MNLISELEKLERIYFDPKYCAKLAGLKYDLNWEEKGWERQKRGKGFVYLDKGKRVEKKIKDQCQALGIPPGWREVRVNPNQRGHLQAVGTDNRGRKQYIYHRNWQEIRERLNFYRILLLARSLPLIKAEVRKHLKLKEWRRRKVTALVVKIMMEEPIRIGNEIYAETNHTFGLTTLEKKHARVTPKEVIFNFLGKSGKRHKKIIKNQAVVKLIREIRQLRGAKLFKFRNRKGKIRPIKANEVNEYLKRVSHYQISAKDFRTWQGTLEAFEVLQKEEKPKTKKETKEQLNQAVEMTAEKLGNTKAMAKKAYIHPRLIESYNEGIFFEVLRKTKPTAKINKFKLRKNELWLVEFLKYFLKKDLGKFRAKGNGKVIHGLQTSIARKASAI